MFPMTWNPSRGRREPQPTAANDASRSYKNLRLASKPSRLAFDHHHPPIPPLLPPISTLTVLVRSRERRNHGSNRDAPPHPRVGGDQGTRISTHTSPSIFRLLILRFRSRSQFPPAMTNGSRPKSLEKASSIPRNCKTQSIPPPSLKTPQKQL